MKKLVLASAIFCMLKSLGFGQRAELMVPAGHADYVNHLAFFGSDRFLASTDGATLRIWDVKKGRLLKVSERSMGYFSKIWKLNASQSALVICETGFMLLDPKDFSKREISAYSLPEFHKGDQVMGGVLSPADQYFFTIQKSRANASDPIPVAFYRLDLAQWKLTLLHQTTASTYPFYKILINKNETEVTFISSSVPGVRLDASTGKLLGTAPQATEADFLLPTQNGTVSIFNDLNAVKVKFKNFDHGADFDYSNQDTTFGSFFEYAQFSKGLIVCLNNRFERLNFETKKVEPLPLPRLVGVHEFTINESENLIAVAGGTWRNLGEIDLFDLRSGYFIQSLGLRLLKASTLKNTGTGAAEIVAKNGNVKLLSLGSKHIETGSAGEKQDTLIQFNVSLDENNNRHLIKATKIHSQLVEEELPKPSLIDYLDQMQSSWGIPVKTITAPASPTIALPSRWQILLFAKASNLFRHKIEGDFSYTQEGEMSADGKYLLLNCLMQLPGEASATNRLVCWDIAGAPKLIWQHPGLFTSLLYNAKLKKITTTRVFEMEQWEVDVTTGKILSKKVLDDLNYSDGDQHRVEVGTGNLGVLQKGRFYLRKFGAPAGQTHYLGYKSSEKYKNFLFVGNPDFVLLSKADGTFDLFNLKKDSIAATLYLFESGNDWLLVTPDGRFDGTSNAMKSLYYSKKQRTIPIGALYEHFYYPELYAKLLTSQPLPAIPSHLKEILLPPWVDMQVSNARNLAVEDDATIVTANEYADIVVRATPEEGTVDEMRVFHNGKLITLTTRNLIVAEDTEVGGAVSKNYRINLLPGNNTVRAIALNNQRTESDPEEVTFYRRNAEAPTPAKQEVVVDGNLDPIDQHATLHLVVVGINEYLNPKLKLGFAVADASSFKSEIETAATSFTKKVSLHYIVDKQANRQGIAQAFEKVKNTAKPEDVFIFYYAGHGIVTPDSNKLFYLVPNDVSALSNVSAELQQKGISSAWLQQAAMDIAAQKQLFVLDACQSAGAFSNMLDARSGQFKSIAQLARNTGTHWMAASGSQEFAAELEQLGHGVFTYSLLQAFHTKGTLQKFITVNGLKNFVQEDVPNLLKKYNKSVQYPASYGSGPDFPVRQ